MAVAKVILKCKYCGEEFAYRKDCMNRKIADSTEEWAKANVDECPECYKKGLLEIKMKKEKASSEKFAPALAEYNLPSLKGTEKQVEWANTIRNNTLGMMLKLKPKENFWEWARTKIDAKWWIDNRNEMNNVYDFCLAIKIDQIPKPKEPEILKGYKWNRKIYGKEDNYSIYLDGNKVVITNEQAKELEQYLSARTEYNSKVNEVRKEYNV